MTLAGMAFRYLRARKGVAFLTILSVALGVALPSVILLLREHSETNLLREGEGVDMVVGGKGSPLQLVLSTVHHLDIPTGNVPYALYESLKQDNRVRMAVPLSLGDNFAGYRIVGVRNAFFDWKPRGQDEAWVRLREGHLPEAPFDAVVGASVAERHNIRIGDRFVGSHGLRPTAGAEHADFPYTVTGILEPTRLAVDRLILTTLEAVWKVHEADEDLHRNLFGLERPDIPREPEVTAVWLQLVSPGLRMRMRDEIHRTTDAMAAVPVDELHRLYQRVMEPVQQALLWIAGAVALVSGLAILSTLLQAADRRRRDWAVLRTLGAHRWEIFLLVWLESLWISTAGVVLGLVLAHGGLALVLWAGAPDFLQGFSPFHLANHQSAVLFCIWLGGACFGLWPAWQGYRRSPVEDLQRET